MTKDEKNTKRRSYYATSNGKAKIQAQQKTYRENTHDTRQIADKLYAWERRQNKRNEQRDVIQTTKAANKAAKEAARAAGQIGYDCIMADGSVMRRPCR